MTGSTNDSRNQLKLQFNKPGGITFDNWIPYYKGIVVSKIVVDECTNDPLFQWVNSFIFS